VSNIHNASFLIDDIEDDSPLRRGKPAIYRVFGRAQTINSANYLWVITSEESFQLNKILGSRRRFVNGHSEVSIGANSYTKMS
jgi:geranylgeranyl pyrophosphate synthase